MNIGFSTPTCSGVEATRTRCPAVTRPEAGSGACLPLALLLCVRYPQNPLGFMLPIKLIDCKLD